MSPEITVTDTPSAEDRKAVLDGLIKFNEAYCGPHEWRPLAVLVREPETGRPLGGLVGASFHGWLFIELFWLPEDLRRDGLGTRLMRAAEAEAVTRRCRGIWLDTYSFQARGFYEKLGFTMFGAVDDFPPGHQRFYLYKRLIPVGAAD